MEESRRSFIRKAALGSAGIALGSRVIGDCGFQFPKLR